MTVFVCNPQTVIFGLFFLEYCRDKSIIALLGIYNNCHFMGKVNPTTCLARIFWFMHPSNSIILCVEANSTVLSFLLVYWFWVRASGCIHREK